MDGRKLVRGKGGLRMVPTNPEYRSAFEAEEPPWEDDSKFHFCQKCMKKFTFTTRRHHCRHCGKIYCSDCCQEKISLPRMCFVDPERVCKDCIPIVKTENVFFDKHLKTLVDGATFVVHEETCFHCYLNPKSKRELLFKSITEDNQASENPVILTNIASIEHITEANEGSEKLVGVIIKIKEENGQRKVRLATKFDSPDIDKSDSFLEALQQAVKLIFDAN